MWVRGIGRRDGEHALPETVTAEWLDSFRRPDAPNPVEDELRIEFSVDASNANVRELLTCGARPTGYEISLCVSRDLAYHFANTVDDDGVPRCPCGAELEYEPNQPWRGSVITETVGCIPAIRNTHVRAQCLACGAAFDPQWVQATVFSHHTALGWDVELTHRGMPMLASRFSLVVDFGADWPREAECVPPFDPTVKQLCEETFGEPFDEVALFT